MCHEQMVKCQRRSRAVKLSRLSALYRTPVNQASVSRIPQRQDAQARRHHHMTSPHHRRLDGDASAPLQSAKCALDTATHRCDVSLNVVRDPSVTTRSHLGDIGAAIQQYVEARIIGVRDTAVNGTAACFMKIRRSYTTAKQAPVWS